MTGPTRQDTPPLPVAFLGLGAIGRPMARHLVNDRFTLSVWNRTGDKAASFGKETGARVARTPADAVRNARVVITCFPTSADVEGLMDGPDGLAAGLVKGALFIDCTSGDPATSRRLAVRLGAVGVDFIDAPVSGGTAGAEKGALTIMCGGSAVAFQRAQVVLSAFGKKVVHCGEVGTGDALKAVNNALLAVHLWSAAEGLVALAKAGVKPSVALDVINTSSGRSNASENLIPSRVMTREFPRTFRLALLDKDVGIAAEVAREQGVPAPMLQLAADMFRAAHVALGNEVDHSEVVRMVERSAGREIA